MTATLTTAEKALALRSEVISILTSAQALQAVHEFGQNHNPRPHRVGSLPEEHLRTSYSELTRIETWTEERWTLQPDNSVAAVSEEDFDSTSPDRRFSFSDSLREGADAALAIRGLLSGIRSDTVARAFSDAYGNTVEYRSSDVARYRTGHYLRRHADTYEDRVFGVLAFLSPDWSHRHGGELVVEAPDGSVDCIAPEPGTLAMLPIRPGFQHLVSRIRTTDWIRFSIASHFSLSLA